MYHTVLPANYTISASTSISVHHMAPPPVDCSLLLIYRPQVVDQTISNAP